MTESSITTVAFSWVIGARDGLQLSGPPKSPDAWCPLNITSIFVPRLAPSEIFSRGSICHPFTFLHPLSILCYFFSLLPFPGRESLVHTNGRPCSVAFFYSRRTTVNSVEFRNLGWTGGGGRTAHDTSIKTALLGWWLLISRLYNSFGISGPVLSWLKSYLHNRPQSVRVGSASSNSFTLSTGVGYIFRWRRNVN